MISYLRVKLYLYLAPGCQKLFKADNEHKRCTFYKKGVALKWPGAGAEVKAARVVWAGTGLLSCLLWTSVHWSKVLQTLCQVALCLCIW